MIVVAARSGQFPEPQQYPLRSSLVAWWEGNRHARLPSTQEANVLKIADEERKLGGCMLTGLPTPMAPGLVEELRAENQPSSESSRTIGRSRGASIASSHQLVVTDPEFVRWNEEAVSRCTLFSSQVVSPCTGISRFSLYALFQGYARRSMFV
ncbi:hypothetical protein RHMOL_Rhmol13G0074700 [Rhododendron molle]|uniref:Uncharacterized protein n=1 Tax=Rhododendron molle TaxID=49168 RepID=A0ACC0L401_RHOML|nr:hypothetical protein RHMOL_Rhmol13G0074700 [Rhododendron molle]